MKIKSIILLTLVSVVFFSSCTEDEVKPQTTEHVLKVRHDTVK